MKVAIYNSNKIITHVIETDFIPSPDELGSYIECPPWCWVGESIDKPKPDDYIEPKEVYLPSIDERLSVMEQAIIELAELEGNK